MFRPNFCVCVCVTTDVLLNFNGDVDIVINADVKCERSISNGLFTRGVKVTGNLERVGNGSPSWLIYIARDGLGYRLRFLSCTAEIWSRDPSLSLCNVRTLYIVHCSHRDWSPNPSLNPNPAVQIKLCGLFVLPTRIPIQVQISVQMMGAVGHPSRS